MIPANTTSIAVTNVNNNNNPSESGSEPLSQFPIGSQIRKGIGSLWNRETVTTTTTTQSNNNNDTFIDPRADFYQAPSTGYGPNEDSEEALKRAKRFEELMENNTHLEYYARIDYAFSKMREYDDVVSDYSSDNSIDNDGVD